MGILGPGEEGRQALLAGTAKFTDEPYIQTFQDLAEWAPYLPEGYEAVKYPDAQSLFTLGQGVIYPTGSWEISLFEDQADFEMGIFPPYVANEGDTCYISDHTDIAIGMNAATPHPEEAQTFLSWVASEEFAALYANALPGFFPLSNAEVTLDTVAGVHGQPQGDLHGYTSIEVDRLHVARPRLYEPPVAVREGRAEA